MNLIDLFESKPFQDVGTFNSIFKTTPILGYPSNAEVEIKELTAGGSRKVLVSGETLFLDLTQKKIIIEKERASVERRNKTTKLFKRKRNLLPEIYRRLSASEFMIYSAVKELGEIHGVTELERNLALNRKTISQSLPRLISFGLIRTEKASSEGETFLRIILDTGNENK